MLDKRQVARQFDRSAANYGRFDALQRMMNDQLLEWLPTSNTLVDLGCGNGAALHTIKEYQPDAQSIGIDLSAGMLRQALSINPGMTAIQADMEALPLADKSIDLIYSCAALQWTDTTEVLSEMHRILSPGGHLLLATLVDDTLSEWHKAWSIAGPASRVHKMADSKQLMASLPTHHLEVVETKSSEYVFRFASPEDMLHSLKGLGGTHADSNRPRGLLGKNRYRRFREAMLGLGCVARYQVLYVKAKKV